MSALQNEDVLQQSLCSVEYQSGTYRNLSHSSTLSTSLLDRCIGLFCMLRSRKTPIKDGLGTSRGSGPSDSPIKELTEGRFSTLAGVSSAVCVWLWWLPFVGKCDSTGNGEDGGGIAIEATQGLK
jgi:hypothetical protein